MLVNMIEVVLTFFPSAMYFSLPAFASVELRAPIPLNAPPAHPATSTANGIFRLLVSRVSENFFL
jgi:hypothetical protein